MELLSTCAQCNRFYRFYIWKMYMHSCKSIKKQKVTLQTQNDVSMTYIITFFSLFSAERQCFKDCNDMKNFYVDRKSPI